jgi:hypothetical protein
MPTLNQSLLAGLTKNPVLTVILLGCACFYIREQDYLKLLHLFSILFIVTLFEYIRSPLFVKKKLEGFNKDEKIIQTHWTQEKDIITVTWITRCLYILAFVFLCPHFLFYNFTSTWGYIFS